MKKIFMLFIVLLPLISYSENTVSRETQDQKELLLRIKELEKRVNEGDEALKRAEITSDKNSAIIEISKSYADSANNLVRNFWQCFFGLITVCSFIGTLIMYYLIKLFIRKKIEEFVQQKEKTIVNIFKKNEKENSLLDCSKILIINKKGTSVDRNFLMILNRFSNIPKVIDIENIEDFSFKKTYKDYDVIVLDNTNSQSDKENWNFNQNNIEKDLLVVLADEICSNKIAFLYFGKQENDGRFSYNVKPENMHLLNFANQPATLFANLIDMLDYRRLLLNK